MKKISVLRILSICLLSMVLISCGGDEDSPTVSNPFIGTWLVPSDGVIWDFKSDGTGEERVIDSTTGEPFLYSVDGNELTLTETQRDTPDDIIGDDVFTFVISGNTATLTDVIDGSSFDIIKQ